jgi:hypothetical protein
MCAYPTGGLLNMLFMSPHDICWMKFAIRVRDVSTGTCKTSRKFQSVQKRNVSLFCTFDSLCFLYYNSENVTDTIIGPSGRAV